MADALPFIERATRIVGSGMRSLLSWVWPRTCALCGRTLDPAEECLCLHCLTGLPRLPRTRGVRSMVCLGAPGGAVRVVSWFAYNQAHPSHRLIHDIKYHDRRYTAEKLGREFGREVLSHGDIAAPPVDIVLPIPLHWTKHLDRGYNQAREVARGFCEVTGSRLGNNLVATRAHETQTARGSTERAKNVEGVFGVVRPGELDGRHVAVLDDVITTGATIMAAIQVILNASTPASLTAISLGNTRLD